MTTSHLHTHPEKHCRPALRVRAGHPGIETPRAVQGPREGVHARVSAAPRARRQACRPQEGSGAGSKDEVAAWKRLPLNLTLGVRF